MNCLSTDQKGVMTLFDNKYELILHHVDNDDRIAMVNVRSESQHLIIANVYCPNDHRESINTVENLYHNLLKLKYDSPEGHVVLMGDLNACITSRDHLNRAT
jgi:exonuclease III